MSLLQDCCEFIKQFEGFSAEPYRPLPTDRPTIGWGNTRYEDGTSVEMDDEDISEENAQKLLEFWVQKTMMHVHDSVEVKLSDNEFLALTSFEYNTGHLQNSTLLEKLNGSDYEGAADEFLRWVHSGGKVVQGLVHRRQLEKEMFES